MVGDSSVTWPPGNSHNSRELTLKETAARAPLRQARFSWDSDRCVVEQAQGSFWLSMEAAGHEMELQTLSPSERAGLSQDRRWESPDDRSFARIGVGKICSP